MTKGRPRQIAADSGKAIRKVELTRTRPVTVLRLPRRAENALLRNGVYTVAQLIARSRNEVLAEVVGLGVGSLRTVEDALAMENLSLAKETRVFARARPYSRPKHRHIKNHNEWLSSSPQPDAQGVVRTEDQTDH